ncbi:MAG: CDP-glycerol glycerophosphotransferase family protein, partial [bacterium]
DHRTLLFFAKAPMNVVIFRPIVERLRRDPRLEMHFTGFYDVPGDPKSLYARFGMEGERLVRAGLLTSLRRYDLYLSPDMYLLARRARAKAHLFHGVSFKGKAYSDQVLRYDRLFLVGEDMRRRFIQRGILKEGDRRLAKIGMPKTDPLVNGSLDRAAILKKMNLDPSRKTVLYAPTWRPEASLYHLGRELIPQLARGEFNFLVKLHDLVYTDSRVDWRQEMAKLEGGNFRLITDFDITPYLFVTDVLISDASSVANEFLLLDRPIVFLDCPELLKKYEATADLETWGRKTGTVVASAAEFWKALDDSLRNPQCMSETRRQAAADIFYNPGTATDRAVEECYRLLRLAPP